MTNTNGMRYYFFITNIFVQDKKKSLDSISQKKY